MTLNYAKFLLSVSFVLNMFLGYYFFYSETHKESEDKSYLYDEITNKEKNIVSLRNSIKIKDIKIDSLLSLNTKIEVKSSDLREKIKISKKDEKDIHTRITNIDDATLIRELSNEEFE